MGLVEKKEKFGKLQEEMASEEELKDIASEVESTEKMFATGETETLLSGEYDSHNAILKISTGNGLLRLNCQLTQKRRRIRKASL